MERLRRHLTPGALAKASGVSHHTILRLERGEGITDMVDLVCIGLVLEVQATDLLRRSRGGAPGGVLHCRSGVDRSRNRSPSSNCGRCAPTPTAVPSFEA